MNVTINRERLVQLVQELIRIDSVNPYLDADGAGEAGIAAFIADKLRSIGLEVAVIFDQRDGAQRHRDFARKWKRQVAHAERAHGHGERQTHVDPAF